MPEVIIRYALPIDVIGQATRRAQIEAVAKALPQIIVDVFSVPESATAKLEPYEVTVLPRPYQDGDVYDARVVFVKVEANDFPDRHPKFEDSEVRIAEGIRGIGRIPKGLRVGVWVVPIPGGRYAELRT